MSGVFTNVFYLTELNAEVSEAFVNHRPYSRRLNKSHREQGEGTGSTEMLLKPKLIFWF